MNKGYVYFLELSHELARASALRFCGRGF